jgi:hypothetical protein
MRVRPVAALLAISLAATVAADVAYAKLNRQEFCAATRYCRIPARFLSGPFLAKPLLREVPLREIQKRCSDHAVIPFGVASPVVGCARFQSENCVVYLPKEVRAISQEMFDMVVEHELAHCRGWVHGR